MGYGFCHTPFIFIKNKSRNILYNMAYYIKTKLEDGTVQELTCEENDYVNIDDCFSQWSPKYVSKDGVELTVDRCDSNEVNTSFAFGFDEKTFPNLKKLILESNLGDGCYFKNGKIEEVEIGEDCTGFSKGVSVYLPGTKILTFKREKPAAGYDTLTSNITQPSDLKPEVIYVPKGSETAYAKFNTWFQNNASIIKALPGEPTVIDHITVGGNDYEIADTKARADIEALKSGEVDAYTKDEVDGLLYYKQDKMNGNYLSKVDVGGSSISIETKAFVNEAVQKTDNINFKTINGNPIFGMGDIKIEAGSSAKEWTVKNINSVLNTDLPFNEVKLGDTIIITDSNETVNRYLVTSKTTPPSSLYWENVIITIFNTNDKSLVELYGPEFLINTDSSVFYNVKTTKLTTDIEMDGLKLKKITQSAYDALGTKDNNTLYIIVD